MTPQEAIKELRDASDGEVRYGDTEHHYDEVMKRVEALDMAIQALAQQPCENKIIDEHYKKGFANGIRTAEWRYNHAIKEIREHADRLKDSLYGDGLRYALEIIDKYKVESEDKE